jgi:hypothetical protein
MYNTLDCFRCAGRIVVSEVLFKEIEQLGLFIPCTIPCLQKYVLSLGTVFKIKFSARKCEYGQNRWSWSKFWHTFLCSWDSRLESGRQDGLSWGRFLSISSFPVNSHNNTTLTLYSLVVLAPVTRPKLNNTEFYSPNVFVLLSCPQSGAINYLNSIHC